MNPSSAAEPALRILVAGATGYIGRFVVRELVSRGHDVVCLLRRPPGDTPATVLARLRGELPGAELRVADITDPESLRDDGLRGERFEVFVSCIASRTGAPADAWKVDYQANCHLLQSGSGAGIRQFILLSAICVQKPLLAFQHAKLAFEKELAASGLCYSIVRPTAFFKSLAGQVDRVRRGRSFVVFGNGELTACKPIAESDLATFIVDCIGDRNRHDRILPVGGPGEPVSPREQANMLFTICGVQPRFRQIPVWIFDGIIATLGGLSKLFPILEAKAEFARIGRYYATESMLVLDPETGHYSADATPGHGSKHLVDFYQCVVRDGLEGQELGEQAFFGEAAGKTGRVNGEGRG